MKAHAIIKSGTKHDPIWMCHWAGKDGTIILKEDDDNLPDLQPFPEFIDKDELTKLGGEIVELEIFIK